MGLLSTLRGFSRDKRGSVAMMTGMMIPVLATGVMASVEYNSIVAAKTKMQNRADAAALFAANRNELLEEDSADDLQASTQELIQRAVEQSGIRVKDVASNYVYDAERERVVGEVTFTPKMQFLGSYFLPETITVVTEASPLIPKRVEISLVLDLSGSMNINIPDPSGATSTRIDALRDGVETLITELEGQDTIDANFAVIPYASSVDLTGIALNSPDGPSGYFENAAGGSVPSLCARQDFNGSVPSNCLGTGNNATGDPLGSSQTGIWAAERYISQVDSTFSLSLAPPTASKVPVVTQGVRKDYCGNFIMNAFGRYCIEAAQDIHGTWYEERGAYSTRSGVLSMTSETDDVRDYMEGLVAQGNTAGHLGTAWGLYALTPEWGNVFNHPSGYPASFDDDKAQKIMVVMTDGEFTQTQDTNISDDQAYGYFQAACALAREQGIEIYAVGFLASELTDEQLTQCAGTPVRYYSVENRDDLISAFKKISDSATQVRLSS